MPQVAASRPIAILSLPSRNVTCANSGNAEERRPRVSFKNNASTEAFDSSTTRKELPKVGAFDATVLEEIARDCSANRSSLVATISLLATVPSVAVSAAPS